MGRKPDSSPDAIAKDVTLLKNAIASAKMSTRRFAHSVLARDDRTVRKWLNGNTTMPAFAREKCIEVVRAARRRARDAGGAAAVLAIVFAVYASAYCARPRPATPAPACVAPPSDWGEQSGAVLDWHCQDAAR
jgi:hypothetical protein